MQQRDNGRTLLSAALCLAVLLLPPAGHGGNDSGILRWQGREIAVEFSDQLTPPSRQALRDEWLSPASQSLGQVFGRWPREKLQLAVTPISAAVDDPIPWAEVQRGEIDRVAFYIAAGAPPQALVRHWTTYHELAHLLLPYRGWGDAWFSEGLATYYQNLMQSRAGLISEQAMWQKLQDGFQRGLADTEFAGRPLREVSDRMRQDGGFMRVYWSGAWYFLAVDTRLRMQSRGQLTLDKALEKLNRCCADLALSATEMVDKLDALNRVVLFRPLYDELAATTHLPSYQSIFASLGIALEDGEVSLQQEGPGADIRKGIALATPGGRK